MRNSNTRVALHRRWGALVVGALLAASVATPALAVSPAVGNLQAGIAVPQTDGTCSQELGVFAGPARFWRITANVTETKLGGVANLCLELASHADPLVPGLIACEGLSVVGGQGSLNAYDGSELYSISDISPVPAAPGRPALLKKDSAIPFRARWEAPDGTGGELGAALLLSGDTCAHDYYGPTDHYIVNGWWARA